ncbi:hypothetical protein [Vibrio mediterranei]|uniref:hypothetical protein n=1 Tax=Vibrio mediterranei TaxID=689 RepID=UPI004068A5FC
MSTDAPSKNNEISLAVNDQADLFLQMIQEGYATSLRSHSLPITISDKSLSGAVHPKDAVLKTENDLWSIEYQAAAIKNGPKVEHYFATKAASTIIEGVWDLINTNKCSLLQIKETFMIRFRKLDLRKALKERGAEKSGTQVNKLLEILESSTLTVIRKGGQDNKNTSVSMKGTYLQNARTINSDDPAIDGLYEAILHPFLANDLYRGDYRDISIEYLKGSTELNEVYKALIHMMRHEFTRADAKQEQYSFTLWFDEVLWSAGKLNKMKQDSKRKTLNSLQSILVETGVVSCAENFTKKWVLNSKVGEKDFYISITPSIEWGQDQRRSNKKFMLIQERIDNLAAENAILIK